MRSIAAAAALTLAMLSGQPLPVSAQGAENASEQADRALAVALWQIAVATHTRIGFQSLEAINTVGNVFHDPPDAIALSLDDALDAALAAHPGYEWRRTDDVIVVRPVGAWTDAADPFNRPVRNFRAERTNESQVLEGIRRLVSTGVYRDEHRLSGTPVDFSVESGTVVDLLNALARSADITFWQGGYQPRGQNLSVSLSLVNDRHLRATMQLPAMRPVRGRAN